MNAKRAKKLRAFIKEKMPFLSPTPLYIRGQGGQIELTDMCQRHHYQSMKRLVKQYKGGKA